MSFGPKSLVGLIFAMLGGAAMLFFLIGLGKMAAYSLYGESATGVVSEIRYIAGPRGLSSRPQVVFTDAEGVGHTVESRFGLSNRSARRRATHATGEQVRVLYPEGQPQDAVIADGKSIAWHVFLVLFSSLFVGLGGWLIRKDMKEQRELGWTR